jgi:hypothetical protein
VKSRAGPDSNRGGFVDRLQSLSGLFVRLVRQLRPNAPCNAGAATDDLRHRDSLTLLKGNSTRSISGCYVNPNAKCPVCGDAVYFYANEHGSRVFFDDLGPPWPKHHCTDNPREPVYPRGARPGVRAD